MKKDELKIVTVLEDEELLREKSSKLTVEQIESEEVSQLIHAMKDYLSDEKNGGVGLAAIQVGRPLAIFAFKNFEADRKNPPVQIAINPQLSPIGDVMETDKEACLSIPGQEGQVCRYARIRMRYVDESGQKVNENFEGFTARIIQHEFDHLNGVLFTDKVEDDL